MASATVRLVRVGGQDWTTDFIAEETGSEISP